MSSHTPRAGGVRDLVDRTPADRDRFVDFLRATSILVVMLGHWLISVVGRSGDEITGTSALGTVRPLQLATWGLQVMPVFFFVGGFSNLLAIGHEQAHGGGYRSYLRTRTARLLRPTILFAAVWLVAAGVLGRTELNEASVHFAGQLAAQPLWFLAVYLIVVALAPPMASVHRRWPIVPFVGLPAAVVLFDQLRLHGQAEGLAMANYVLVFLFAQQLGFLYGDGWLTGRSRRSLLVAAAAAFGVLVALTAWGPYPTSMVGVPGEALSNMSPPTVCILVLTVAQVGVLMALRTPANRWLVHRRPWTFTVVVNARIMTLFLWHLTAIVLVAGAAVAVGAPLADAGSAGWWLGRPVWVALSALVLAVLVGAFGWAEAAPHRGAGGRATSAVVGVAGVVLVVRGLIGVAMTGFAPPLEAAGDPFLWMTLSPVLDVALVVAGYLLVQGRRATSPPHGAVV